MRKSLLLWALCLGLTLQAQIPTGYYNNADGKKGSQLKTALNGIIESHTARSYDNLWTDFKKTDRRADGKVWDMYSCTTNFTFGTDQAGNYKKEGDVYNREHSFPKSWFNDAKPMYTDLFHLYPTDGYVNNRRSNYPFGEVASVTYSSNQSYSKLGSSAVSGYSGTVFEPADEYKGDFARTYFYMVTCYEDRITGWSCAMLDGKSYPGLATWALNMLLDWSRNDPVSEKELNRNNAVYAIQGNRNPFIDMPGLEEYIWGNKKNENFSTGINETVADDYKIAVVNGRLMVITGMSMPVRVFNLAGQCILDETVESGRTPLDLPRGMYIINGKKIAVTF